MKSENERAPRAWGFPAFARSFPEDPELDALVTAFANGNYRRVRDEAPSLIARTESAEVRAGAELLLARTRPDPNARWLFVFAGLLLALLTAWWIAHDGPPHTGMTVDPGGAVRVQH